MFFHYSSIPTPFKPRRNDLFSYCLFYKQQPNKKQIIREIIALEKLFYHCTLQEKCCYLNYYGGMLYLVKLTALHMTSLWGLLTPLIFSCLHLSVSKRYPSHREGFKMGEEVKTIKNSLIILKTYPSSK